MTQTRAVARSAAGMGVATAVSRLFGFARVLVVAAVLGTTYLGNTFQATNSFSNVLFELLAAGALSAVLVPTFVELIDRGDQSETERLAGNVLARALIGLGAVTIVAMIAAPWIAQLLSRGDDPAVRAAQEDLATFLLRFFIPQVLLYAVGTVAIAALYAKRRFAVTAAAPIANTVVMVAAMLAFRVMAGPAPGLDLSTGERLTLALGGTLGVAGFVAVPWVALWRAGFRLRPRLDRSDAAIRRLLRLSGWAVLQHTQVGILLGTATVVGNSVEGGVLAYQVAWVFFLAPYAVLAQPIHTAILPELAGQASADDRGAFAGSLRWALDGMATLVVPASIAMMAVALPAMTVVAFGATDRTGVGLLAAGVASLAAGLFFYSAFLLLARAYYALGDSRTPALVAVVTAVGGAVIMIVGARFAHGAALVAVLGFGHSAAYLCGALVLALGLSRRTGHAIVPVALPRAVAIAAVLGITAWWAAQVIEPAGRLANLALVVATGVAGAVLYAVALRALGGSKVALRPALDGSSPYPDRGEVEV